jgi:hypothetical protein
MRKYSIHPEQVEVLFKGHEIPQKRALQEIARRSSSNSVLQNGLFMLRYLFYSLIKYRIL